MPIPAARKDGTGKLIVFDQADVDALGLESRGVRDGSGYQRSLKMGSTTRKIQWIMASYGRDPDLFWDAMVYLMGASTLYTNGSGKKRLSRLTPWTDEEEARLAVTEVNGRGFRFVGDVNEQGLPAAGFQDVDLDCLMELMPFDMKLDADTASEVERYVERLPDQTSAQYLTMPGIAQGLKFQPINKGVPYPVGFPYIKGRIGRKWWRVPRAAIDPGTPLFKRWTGDPDAALPADKLAYINTCNKTTFLGYPPGQLVMLAPEVQPMYDPVSSDWCVNITYWFDWVPNGGRGANYLFYFDQSGGTSGWYLATRGANTAPGTWDDKDVVFPAREFADLFVPGAL